VLHIHFESDKKDKKEKKTPRVGSGSQKKDGSQKRERRITSPSSHGDAFSMGLNAMGFGGSGNTAKSPKNKIQTVLGADRSAYKELKSLNTKNVTLSFKEVKGVKNSCKCKVYKEDTMVFETKWSTISKVKRERKEEKRNFWFMLLV
jgi:hypothetical protein